MYFLAIVSHEDLLSGNIAPSYIMCWSNGDSDKRAQWRIYQANKTKNKASKVLVKYPVGNDLMVDFLSRYRTRDCGHTLRNKRAHERSKKYYPEGALFWFECDEYGEIAGPAVFVKRVPDHNAGKKDDGMHRLAEAQKQIPSVNSLFSRDPFTMPLIHSGVKPKLVQSYIRG